MKLSQDYVRFVQEQLEGLRGLRSARLFGGLGLSVDGVQFAMIIRNGLYFVVDDSTRPAYEAAGSDCFRYETRVRQVEVRRYYEVPGEWLEDRERLLALARESLAIARQDRPGHPGRSGPRPAQ